MLGCELDQTPAKQELRDMLQSKKVDGIQGMLSALYGIHYRLVRPVH